MFGKCKKCDELSAEFHALRKTVSQLQTELERLLSSHANLRGIINRKLYSGKMKQQEEPSLFDVNAPFFGLPTQKDLNAYD